MSSMQIQIHENRYHLDLNQLMVVAHRLNNPKRNFLFVSKALGKHLEVEPNMCRVMGYVLASLRYGRSPYLGQWIDYLYNPAGFRSSIQNTFDQPYEAEEKVAVMGFAETATGLGMAVASAIQGAYYVHTTREAIVEIPNFIQFEEEHSHATQHQCFPLEVTPLQAVDRLILVDDELTTGKSLLNMVSELIRVTPIRKFTMLTILDWRHAEHEAMLTAMCEQHGIEIEVQALIKGAATSTDSTVYQGQVPQQLTDSISERCYLQLDQMPRLSVQTQQGMQSYYRHNGRFGVYQQEIEQMERHCQQAAMVICEKLKDFNWTGKFYGHVLVLGHGEDIYYPSRVAAALSQVFDGLVDFKSTTRSPIYCQSEAGYPIQQAHAFEDEAGVTYFYYNKDQIDEKYDAVILITEKPLMTQLAKRQLTVQL